jgi:O-antigen ligase
MSRYGLQTSSGPATIARLHVSRVCRSSFPFEPPARVPLRIGSLALLVVAVGMSPRIPLPINIPGREFDLRVEDPILVILLVSYLMWLCVYRQIDLTPLAPKLAVYSAIVVLSTSLAVTTGDLSLIRAMPYVFKFFEYFLIFFLMANWVRSIRDLRSILAAIMAVGAANMAWVAVQLVTGTYQTLFSVSADYVPSYMFHSRSYLHYYGPALIGELSPYATGGLFVTVFLLSLGLVLFPVVVKWKWISICLCFGLAVSAFLSGSRAAAGTGAVGAAVLLLLARRPRGLAASVLLGLAVAGALGRMSQAHSYDLSINDRWDAWHLAYGVRDRREAYWKPMLEHGYQHFWWGMGTGALGFLPGTKNEAHNGYLRVFLESGIFGLTAFLWLLFEIIRWAHRTFSMSRSATCKVVSGALVGATVGLGFACLVQDAFVTVVTNELFWVMAGLTMAAYRIERDSSLPASLRGPRFKTACSRPVPV